MSGQATGWVLRHGPRDRAMHAVLVVIADAANRDGKHAHPGVPAMVEGSRYCRATVFAAIRKLVDEGWIEVEQETKPGPNSAAVYRVCMDRESPTVGLSSDRESPERVQRESNPARENGRDSSCLEFNVNVNARGVDAKASTRATAKALTDAWWESHEPRPSMEHIAAVKIVEKILKRFPEPVVRRGLARVGPTFTTAKLDALCRGKPPHRAGGDEHWENAKTIFGDYVHNGGATL